jgi:hypothetical protein
VSKASDKRLREALIAALNCAHDARLGPDRPITIETAGRILERWDELVAAELAEVLRP